MEKDEKYDEFPCILNTFKFEVFLGGETMGERKWQGYVIYMRREGQNTYVYLIGT